MANKKKTTKKPATKKTTKKNTKPKGVKVFFVSEETRAFLLEYLQLSPAGQYSPAAINNVVTALRDAASGTLT